MGKPLAITPEAIDFDWLYMCAKPNKRCGSVEIVFINGPLEHKSGWEFDSYEDILARIEGAMSGYSLEQAQELDYLKGGGANGGFQPGERSPAKAVIMCLNSPGGEAAGATEAHRKIRSLSAQYGIPVYAYADEMACSAAYELASAAQEIWLPDAGVVGSIGVIATAFDRTKQNEMVGLAIELITSGAYKSDGHPDRILDDGIRGRIQERVDDLAAIFFQIVADARDTTPDAISALEAGTFLGFEAVRVGVADGVASPDEFLELVQKSVGDMDVVEAANNVEAAPAA